LLTIIVMAVAAAHHENPPICFPSVAETRIAHAERVGDKHELGGLPNTCILPIYADLNGNQCRSCWLRRSSCE
jgi:hypothetical protein